MLHFMLLNLFIIGLCHREYFSLCVILCYSFSRRYLRVHSTNNEDTILKAPKLSTMDLLFFCFSLFVSDDFVKISFALTRLDKNGMQNFDGNSYFNQKTIDIVYDNIDLLSNIHCTFDDRQKNHTVTSDQKFTKKNTNNLLFCLFIGRLEQIYINSRSKKGSYL